jgi:hypothetical protein
MIRFLAWVYLLNLAGSVFLLSVFSVIGVMMIGSAMPLRGVLHRALFWGALAAAPLTFYELRRRNLWPLFDNLRIPKYLLLGFFVLGTELVNLLLLLWL